jgi:uncharacterized membrane protein
MGQRMTGTQQPQAAEPDNGRLLQFSDGVFAVAITLLVFSLRLPDPQAVAEGRLAQSVWQSRTQFLSFALSFAVVGNFWIVHHRAFRLIRTHDTGLIWLNMLCLFGISILPYPSSLLGQYSDHRFSVVFYAACMAFASLSMSLLWWYVSRDKQLVHKHVAATQIRRLLVRGLVAAAVFLISIPIAFASLTAAELTWASLFVMQNVVARLLRPALDVADASIAAQ